MLNAVREWWRQPDHYYWLTAFLAARGAQRGTCRLIAGAFLCFAGVLIISLGSPAGPSGLTGVVIAVILAGCCVAMALRWRGGRWPTQRQSAAMVIGSALCISAACLIQAEPINGMFGCTTFAVLAGYIAFFHSPRLMTVNFAVAVVTATVLAIRMAHDGDVALAVSTLAFLTVVNFATPYASQALVHLLGINVLNADIEPLTGLYNREGFLRTVAAFIAARNRDDDRFFVIVVIHLDNFALLVQSGGRLAGERARVAAAQTLRETTRSSAVVAHVSDAEFVIADSFPTTDSSPLVERVRGAIRTTPPRTAASIGVVSTPMRGLAEHPPDDVLDELITIARGAAEVARRAGGNRAHHVECPPLTAVGEDEPPQ
jgi:diguanylate cyclase (GGDEF)-like protein